MMTLQEYNLAAKLVPTLDKESIDDETRRRIEELKAAMREFEWKTWPMGCCA